MESKFLVPIKRTGDASPLFFVPSVGTTVLSLVHLARALESPHPFHAFEFLELARVPERLVTMEHVSSLCVEEIRAVQAAGPYYIGGHCWGGAVALDIAARLEAMGNEVVCVTILESIPPLSSEVAARYEPPPEIVKAVTDMFQQVRDRLSTLPAELAKRFGPVTWELIDLSLRYRAKMRVRAPVFLIRSPTHPKSVFQGWNLLTSGGFEERVVPGDAFSILTAPTVKIVAAALDEALRQRGS
jgi:thioesterase domain-containing protein